MGQSMTDGLMKYLLDSEAQTPNYTEIETKIPFEEKKNILLTLGRQDFYNKQLDGEYRDSYASHYHFIDINKDGNLDIVYNSADGADGELLIIWLGDSDNIFNKVIQQPGLLRFWNLDKGSFLVFEWAYFGEIEGKLLHFQLDKDRMKLREVIKYPAKIELPDSFEIITEFRTLNDNYNLRSSPTILNTPCEEYPDGNNYCGNQYKTLPKGTRGLAIAKSIDETGRIWWLSKIPDSSSMSTIGWLSSKYVEKY